MKCITKCPCGVLLLYQPNPHLEGNRFEISDLSTLVFGKVLEQKWLRQSNFKGHKLCIRKWGQGHGCRCRWKQRKVIWLLLEHNTERNLERKFRSVQTFFCSFGLFRYHSDDICELGLQLTIIFTIDQSADYLYD